MKGRDYDGSAKPGDSKLIYENRNQFQKRFDVMFLSANFDYIKVAMRVLGNETSLYAFMTFITCFRIQICAG